MRLIPPVLVASFLLVPAASALVADPNLRAATYQGVATFARFTWTLKVQIASTALGGVAHWQLENANNIVPQSSSACRVTGDPEDGWLGACGDVVYDAPFAMLQNGDGSYTVESGLHGSSPMVGVVVLDRTVV